MPSLSILTFCCVFYALSRTLLTPCQVKKSSDITPNVVQVEVPEDLNAGDLETVVAIANALHHTQFKN